MATPQLQETILWQKLGGFLTCTALLVGEGYDGRISLLGDCRFIDGRR